MQAHNFNLELQYTPLLYKHKNRREAVVCATVYPRSVTSIGASGNPVTPS